MYIIGEEEIEAVAKVIRSGKLFRYGHGISARPSSAATPSTWASST